MDEDGVKGCDCLGNFFALGEKGGRGEVVGWGEGFGSSVAQSRDRVEGHGSSSFW